jgi:ketosteroid isomerase-like protein
MRETLGLMFVLTAAAILGFVTTHPKNIASAPSSLASDANRRVWQSDRPEQAIRAVLATQQAAWNRGDIPAFLQGYWNSPDLTFAGNEGIVRGYDGLLARYQKDYPDRQAMGELDFSELETRPLGPDAALVLGRWHLRRDTGDVGGVFSLVFERFPIGWRIIHDHTSAQKQTR